MQMCTSADSIQPTWAWRCINDSAISGWSRGPVREIEDQTRHTCASKYISSWAFITLLKYSKCGGSQHLDKAFDVRDVAFLPSKYVNNLNEKRENDVWVSITFRGIILLSRPWSAGGVPAVPGPELRPVGRRRRSAPASRSAEPPWAQNRVAGFEPTYQTPHTLPGGRGRESCGCKQCMQKHTHARHACTKETTPTSTTSESSSHLLRRVWISGNTCCSTTTTWRK